MTASYARRPYASFYSLIRLSFLALALISLSGCETTSSPDYTDSGKHRFSLFSYNIRSNGHQCMAEWRKAPPLPPSLWQRVENRYQMPNSTTNPRIITERNWYTSHQSYLNRVSARSARYLYYVANQLEARNLPGELALLPIVESAYNPFAISTSQASGLWQFIPSTAKHLKMEMNWWYDARRDIPAATDSALNYLIFLRDHYEGDWLKALAAYNAGWGTIDRAVAKTGPKACQLITGAWMCLMKQGLTCRNYWRWRKSAKIRRPLGWNGPISPICPILQKYGFKASWMLHLPLTWPVLTVMRYTS